jgi:putative FmdB family regulatory protein
MLHQGADLGGGARVVTYLYTCPDHGGFDVRRPMSAANDAQACPSCDAPSRRVFTTPMLTRTHRALAAALGRDERSADAPEVVTSLPPREARPQRRPPPPRGLPRL